MRKNEWRRVRRKYRLKERLRQVDFSFFFDLLGLGIFLIALFSLAYTLQQMEIYQSFGYVPIPARVTAVVSEVVLWLYVFAKWTIK